MKRLVLICLQHSGMYVDGNLKVTEQTRPGHAKKVTNKSTNLDFFAQPTTPNRRRTNTNLRLALLPNLNYAYVSRIQPNTQRIREKKYMVGSGLIENQIRIVTYTHGFPRSGRRKKPLFLIEQKRKRDCCCCCCLPSSDLI